MGGPALESPLQDLPVLEKGRRPLGDEQEPGTCRPAPCTPVQITLALYQDNNSNNNEQSYMVGHHTNSS